MCLLAVFCCLLPLAFPLPASYCFPLLFLLILQQKSEVPMDYDHHDPEHKQIYRFVRTLFSAAQLTSECAIVTLVSYSSSSSSSSGIVIVIIFVVLLCIPDNSL